MALVWYLDEIRCRQCCMREGRPLASDLSSMERCLEPRTSSGEGDMYLGLRYHRPMPTCDWTRGGHAIWERWG